MTRPTTGKRWARPAALGLSLTLLLTACGGRELTDVTLLGTLGVDGPGPVVLTAVAAGEDQEVYQTQGADMAQAQAGLAGLGTTRLETTHIQQLVLGAGAEVERCLWQEITHRESGYGATVWLRLEGPAAELLEGTGDLTARLRSLEENGGAQAPTILEALSDLTLRGRTRLPVLEGIGPGVRLAGYETVEVRQP